MQPDSEAALEASTNDPAPSTAGALPQAKQNLAFTINGKRFDYRGYEDQRERDFFQLYIKTCKGDVSPEDALRCFRENLPFSGLPDSTLQQHFQRQLRRRTERDKKKSTGPARAERRAAGAPQQQQQQQQPPSEECTPVRKVGSVLADGGTSPPPPPPLDPPHGAETPPEPLVRPQKKSLWNPPGPAARSPRYPSSANTDTPEFSPGAHPPMPPMPNPLDAVHDAAADASQSNGPALFRPAQPSAEEAQAAAGTPPATRQQPPEGRRQSSGKFGNPFSPAAAASPPAYRLLDLDDDVAPIKSSRHQPDSAGAEPSPVTPALKACRDSKPPSLFSTPDLPGMLDAPQADEKAPPPPADKPRQTGAPGDDAAARLFSCPPSSQPSSTCRTTTESDDGNSAGQGPRVVGPLAPIPSAALGPTLADPKHWMTPAADKSTALAGGTSLSPTPFLRGIPAAQDHRVLPIELERRERNLTPIEVSADICEVDRSRAPMHAPDPLPAAVKDEPPPASTHDGGPSPVASAAPTMPQARLAHEAPDFLRDVSQTGLSNGTSWYSAQSTAQRESAVRKSNESNGGWAAEPKRGQNTAWERRLLRAAQKDKEVKERGGSGDASSAKEQRESESGADASGVMPPLLPQRSSSPPLPPGQTPGAVRRSRGQRSNNDARRASKEGRREKKDKGDTVLQKMMYELFERTNEMKERIAQLEVASPRNEGSSECISNPTSSFAPQRELLHQVSEIISLVKQNEKGRTILHDVAERGNCEELLRVLAQGANIEARDRQGRTPLQVACFLGHLPVVHLLSSRGADMEAEDNAGMTGPALAARTNQVRVLEYLHLRGCPMDTRDRYGRAPLHHAVQARPDGLLALLGVEGINKNVRDLIRSQTPLHYAATFGHVEAVNALLASGAAVSLDYDGNGPLALAAISGHREAVSALVQHSSGPRSWTALHHCAISRSNLQAFLMSDDAGPEPDLDQPDSAGQSLLQLSTMAGAQANVDFLITKNVSLSHRDKLGRTALHLAASRGQTLLCKSLVRAGAPLDIEDAFRMTPYQSALHHGHKSTAVYLMLQGADHLYHKSFSYLMELAHRQAPSHCSLVVRAFKSDLKGASFRDARIDDSFARTALHAASLIGDESGVATILASNEGVHCNVRAEDDRGWTALHYAAARDCISYKRLPGIQHSLTPGAHADAVYAYNGSCTSELSVTAFNPNQVSVLSLNFSISKGASQVGVIRQLLQTRTHACEVPTDLREIRAYDGRRPVDVARDEGCEPEIINLLTPNNDYPQRAYTGFRWAIAALFGFLWGLIVLPPTAFYYTLRRKQLSLVLSEPMLTLMSATLSLSRTMKQWILGEEVHEHFGGRRGVARAKKFVVYSLVVCFFLFYQLLPLAVIAGHSSQPYKQVGDAEMLLWPNASTDVFGQNDSLDVGETEADEETGRMNRDVVATGVACIWFLFCLLAARHVFCSQKSGLLTVRTVSRRIDFLKKGNWPMLAFAIIDPLMLAAVPMVSAGESSGGIPLFLRALVFDTMHPYTAAFIAFSLCLFWHLCCGVACLSATVPSSMSLSRRLAIFQADTMARCPPYFVHFLSHTMLVPILLSFTRLFKCEYTPTGPFLSHTIGTGDPLPCYTGAHTVYCTLASSLGLLYIVTASTIGILWSQPKGGEADISWGHPLLAAEKVLYVGVVGFVSAFFESIIACHVIFFFFVFAQLLFVTRLDDVTSPTTSVLQWRMLGYTFSIMALACAAFLYSENSAAAGDVIVCIVFVTALTVAWALYRFNQFRFLSAERAEAFRRLASFREQPYPAARTVAIPIEETNDKLPPPAPFPLNTPSCPSQTASEVDVARPQNTDISLIRSSLPSLPPLPQPLLDNPMLTGRDYADIEDEQEHNATAQMMEIGVDQPEHDTGQSTPPEPDGWVMVGLSETNPIQALSSMV
ncbi:hypothetical protein DIPPA_18977, partial [Diplonema papillatum]